MNKNKAAQDSLSAEEKLERQNDLVHMMVHDLKTPLMGIISNLDLVVNAKNLSELEKEFANTAMEGSQELYSMVMDILDLGKMETGILSLEFSSFDLGELAQRELKKFKQIADGNKVNVHFEKKGDLSVTADERIMKRIMANLISNGLKYTPPGKNLQVFAEDAGESVKIRVKDEGPGVPSEYKERIFDKYFQIELRSHRKKGATGLGLPFCKMAAEAHNGEITLISTEEGSEFTVSIPKEAAG